MFEKIFWLVKQEMFFEIFQKHWQTNSASQEMFGNVCWLFEMWPNHQTWKRKQNPNGFQTLFDRLAGALVRLMRETETHSLILYRNM